MTKVRQRDLAVTSCLVVVGRSVDLVNPNRDIPTFDVAGALVHTLAIAPLIPPNGTP